MRPLFFAIYFEFWFFICFSANIEPNAKACINNFELSFFCDAQQFNPAKKACQERGSYLVKIDNANMTKIIRDMIDQMTCTRGIDFHGGATADSNRRWTWLDGNKVYLRGEDGYQNWQSDQPNDFGGEEDCMVIKTWTTKWHDYPCAGIAAKYYICQKNLTLSIKITKLDYYGINCSTTSGTCVTQIEWRRNNKTVSTLKNYSVYQELSSGTSILHYENATINDGGEYTCVTWVRKNEANRESALAYIKVNRTPEVIDIFSFACNSSLMIFWNPHPRSIGFLHRIIVINSYSGDLVREIMITPVRNTRQTTEIVGLQSATNYSLRISACIDKQICTDEHTVNATATTGGLVIKNATMITNNDTCILSWNWPYDISAVFKIKLNSGNQISETVFKTFVNKTENDLSYTFVMQPEQFYDVRIKPTGSTKFCHEHVDVIGFCSRINIPTTSGQVTVKDEKTHFISIIVPVVASVSVILLLTVAYGVYKMKTRTEQSNHSNTKPTINKTDDAADYATVGDGDINAAYSTIGDEPAVYVNYQQNSPYETVETNQHSITDIYETPISGK